jgi:hypothetical protein
LVQQVVQFGVGELDHFNGGSLGGADGRPVTMLMEELNLTEVFPGAQLQGYHIGLVLAR